MGFANIFVIVLLAVVVYGDKLKWYAYMIGMAVIIAAYKLFICRTGLVVFGMLCIMVIGYYVMQSIEKQRVYTKVFSFIPFIMAIFTIILPIVTRKSQEISAKINEILNGRLWQVGALYLYDEIKGLWLGHMPSQNFDNMYFQLLYNYG